MRTSQVYKGMFQSLQLQVHVEVIGFNGAETNCRIAHILGILLMNSCNTDRFLATTVVCGLSTLNSRIYVEQ